MTIVAPPHKPLPRLGRSRETQEQRERDAWRWVSQAQAQRKPWERRDGPLLPDPVTPTPIRRKLSFRQWLHTQRHRHHPVGHLAADMAPDPVDAMSCLGPVDKVIPRGAPFLMYAQYLRCQGASREAELALERAWIEWRTVYGGPRGAERAWREIEAAEWATWPEVEAVMKHFATISDSFRAEWEDATRRAARGQEASRG